MSNSLGEEVKDWVVSILVAVVLAFFIRYFIVELYLVDGPSMLFSMVSLYIRRITSASDIPDVSRGASFISRYLSSFLK